MSYYTDAIESAKDMIREYKDQLIEDLIEKDEIDIYQLSESQYCYHHESHVDKLYDLSEAAQLLRELNDFEETDRGLWESQDPQDAVYQAAYTYGNAVMHHWFKLIKEINEEYEEHKSTFDELESREPPFNEFDDIKVGGDRQVMGHYCDYLEENGDDAEKEAVDMLSKEGLDDLIESIIG